MEIVMMDHILLAYDGSEQAEKAFNLAIDLAHRYQSKLTVLAVTSIPERPNEVETDDILGSSIDNYKKLFERLKQKADPLLPMPIDFHIVRGQPAEIIVSEAERLGVDHIIMGHRGNTLFHRWLLGSVAKQVMIYAHCAITIVR
jgi:nucleotide-binding universal stress UspA family protein